MGPTFKYCHLIARVDATEARAAALSSAEPAPLSQ